MKISKRIIRIINFQSFISDLFFHICLFTFAFLLLTSCETTEPPPSNQKLTLVAEDASCTEAWLNLKLENSSLPTEIELKQNNTTIITTNVNSNDTTLFVENLLPSQTYIFQATNIKYQVSSNKVSVTAMDTTSHNFTWETFTIGDGGLLRDVAVIDENNIWAVGEIHTEDTDKFDSNGVWVQPYNAVHWDGNEWELKRIMFPTDADQPNGHKSAKECRAIYIFSQDDFIISSSVQIALMNSQNNYNIEKMGFKWEDRFTINSIWGTSSEDFYVVGNGGNIAHYNGSSWRKIESGTDVDLVDIWGSSDGKKIWVCGNDDFKPTVLLKMENNKTDIMYNSRDNRFSYDFNHLSGDFTSIWSDDKNSLYILTAYDLYRIYKGNIADPKALWKNRAEQIATRKARGTNSNNIFIVGENGSLCHYNGVSWKTYSELYERFRDFKSISVNKNIIVVVGQDYIIRNRR